MLEITIKNYLVYKNMKDEISRETMLKIYALSLKLHKNKGFNSYEIARMVNKKFRVNFCIKTIYNWINKGSILYRPKPLKSILYNLYYNKNLSLKQIANKLKRGKTSVKKYLKIYKIRIRKSREGQMLRLQKDGKFGGYLKDKLTKKQKEFIFGTLLGDGSLYLCGRHKNARLKIEHTRKDRKYVEFKHSIIKNFVTGKIMDNVVFNKRVKKHYLTSLFITTTHPEFTKFHKLFYKKSKKIVNKEILEKISPFGLAFWVMDDGCYSKTARNICLYTMGFSYDEHLLIQKWFKAKYKIYPKTSYHKQSGKYYMRFNTIDSQKLVSIIKPYIIPSMIRKIGLKI